MIILVIIGYILINLYLLFSSWRWMRLWLKSRFHKVGKICLVILYVLIVLPGPAAYFMKPGSVQAAMQRFNNCWLGVLIYYCIFSVIIDLILLILKYFKRAPRTPKVLRNWSIGIGAVFFGLVLSVSIYGMHHANQIHLNRHEINVNKKVPGMEKMKVVLIADLHMGYSIGLGNIRDMVAKVNSCNPDLIIIAGDIFDNSYDAIEHPDEILQELKKLDSTFGTYAVYGNHDINEKLFCGFSVHGRDTALRDEREDEFLKKAGITVLEDSSICVDDSFYLVGRLDAQKSGDGLNKRKTVKQLLKDLDKEKAIFVIDHEPLEIDETAQAGADIQFCGHTHAGQFFPLNIACSILWENAWGILKKDDMYNIVTSGIGVYGPDMRVGTDSEIMEIIVNFSK